MASAPPTVAWFFWNRGWVPYDDEGSATLESALQHGQPAVSIGPYDINFSNAIQRNTNTGFRRRIRRIVLHHPPRHPRAWSYQGPDGSVVEYNFNVSDMLEIVASHQTIHAVCFRFGHSERVFSVDLRAGTHTENGHAQPVYRPGTAPVAAAAARAPRPVGVKLLHVAAPAQGKPNLPQRDQMLVEVPRQRSNSARPSSAGPARRSDVVEAALGPHAARHGSSDPRLTVADVSAHILSPHRRRRTAPSPVALGPATPSAAAAAAQPSDAVAAAVGAMILGAGAVAIAGPVLGLGAVMVFAAKMLSAGSEDQSGKRESGHAHHRALTAPAPAAVASPAAKAVAAVPVLAAASPPAASAPAVAPAAMVPATAAAAAATQGHRAMSALTLAEINYVPAEASITECPICLEQFTEQSAGVRLVRCHGHGFHLTCVAMCITNDSLQCPCCKAIYGQPVTGTQPPGEMTVLTTGDSLPGHPSHGTIVIHYKFPGGAQGPEHPTPGQYYRGDSRTAYLPNSPEGRVVLAKLQTAWRRRLLFTIAQSMTVGPSGGERIVWAGVHHKTGRSGPHGYPDPGYLARASDELAQFGI